MVISGGSGLIAKPRSSECDTEKITASGLQTLVEKQGYRCALTGRSLDPDTASVDHVVPLSRGGVNRMSNVQVLHIDVNKAKGAMTTDEFIDLCKEVVGFALAPRQGSADGG